MLYINIIIWYNKISKLVSVDCSAFVIFYHTLQMTFHIITDELEFFFR